MGGGRGGELENRRHFVSRESKACTTNCQSAPSRRKASWALLSVLFDVCAAAMIIPCKPRFERKSRAALWLFDWWMTTGEHGSQ